MTGPSTEVIDLEGHMVIPGINDVHAHPIEGAKTARFAEGTAGMAWHQQACAPRSAERLKKAVLAAAAKLNGFCITSIQDALVDRDLLSAWHPADTDGAGLPIRVIASLAGDHGEPNSAELPSKADCMRSEHLRPNYIDGLPMA